MKIDSSITSAVTVAKTRQQRPAGSGSTTGVASESTVATLNHSQALDQTGAPADSERIAEIRQAIADGKLQINAERIADRLIQGVQEQFAKGRQS